PPGAPPPASRRRAAPPSRAASRGCRGRRRRRAPSSSARRVSDRAPRARRPARAAPPFSGTRGVLMRSYARGVEEEPLEVGLLEVLEEPGPDAALGPAVEPPPYGVPAPELGGEVAPGAAVAGDPDDGVEKASVVVAGAAGGTGPSGQERGEALPGGVGEGVAGHSRRSR